MSEEKKKRLPLTESGDGTKSAADLPLEKEDMILEDIAEESDAGISDDDYSAILAGILAQDAVTVPPEETAQAESVPETAETAEEKAPAETDGAPKAQHGSGELLKKILSFKAARSESADEKAAESDPAPAKDDADSGESARTVDVGANTDVFEDYEYVSNGNSDDSDDSAESDADDASAETSDESGAENAGAEASDASEASDEDDSDLMVALGYSEGSEAAERASRRNKDELKRRIGDIGSDYVGAFGYRGEEYRSNEQTDAVKKAYRSDSLSMILRAAGTAIFALVIVIYELFGKKFGGAISAADYPAVHILVSLQLLLLAAAFSWRQLVRGLVGIFRFELTPHSASAAAVVSVLVYDAALAVAAPDSFTLYNIPAAFCLVMSVVYDILDLERQVRAFNALSGFETCCTLERADQVELAAALGGSSSAGKEDARITTAMRLRRGNFAENYFKRTNKKNPALRALNYVIAPVMALSLVVFLISLAAGRGFVPSANTFTVMVLIAMPVFTMAGLIYPFCDMAKNLLRPTEVLLNEAEAEEYAGTDAVIFGEDDVFGPRSLLIKRIGLCGGAMASEVFEVLEGAATVFDKVGGVLAGAFRRAADSSIGGNGTDVGAAEIKRLGDGGIAAEVGGRKYFIGNESFMTLSGIAAPVDRDDRAFAENGGSAVMYIAVDGEVALKMYISYIADEEFRGLVTTLSDRGIRPVMISNDPNIDDALMARLLGQLKCPLRVIRSNAETESEDGEKEEKTAKDSVDAGLIADGSDWTSLVGALPACGKLCRVSELNNRISLGIIVLSVLLATFLGALGILGGMHSAYVLLYQIICVLPAVITSKLMLN